MAEAHPVGFRWVMKAKERGARVIHVDPRYGRTSQMADLYVPIPLHIALRPMGVKRFDIPFRIIAQRAARYTTRLPTTMVHRFDGVFCGGVVRTADRLGSRPYLLTQHPDAELLTHMLRNLAQYVRDGHVLKRLRARNDPERDTGVTRLASI